MILTNLNKSSLTQALEDNMSGKFAYFPSLSPAMTVTDKEILVINSHQASDMFNIICKSKTNNMAHLKQAIEIFKQAQLPFAWWTGFQNEPDDLALQLKKLGLQRVENELGMAVTLSELPSKDVFHGLDIKVVNTKIQLNDFINVLTELVPDDKIAIENFYSKSEEFILSSDSLLKLYVGYLKQKPIATSALFADSGVAGVWDVVTLTEARHKGIATDMTLYSLNQGKKLGFLVGVLTASDEARVYIKNWASHR